MQGDEDSIAQLEAVPSVPRLAAHIWEHFQELNRDRGYGPTGQPLTISYRDLRAWRLETGTVIEPWERHALRRLDDAYLASVAEQQKQAEAARPKPGGM
jgi:hypothetical protein